MRYTLQQAMYRHVLGDLATHTCMHICDTCCYLCTWYQSFAATLCHTGHRCCLCTQTPGAIGVIEFYVWQLQDGRSFYFLRADQVEVGDEISKGSYGSIRMLKSIASAYFSPDRSYVGKVLISQNGCSARRALMTEATNLACLSHPALVMGLGMTLTDPCLLVMEYWPHGHLGRYWYVCMWVFAISLLGHTNMYYLLFEVGCTVAQ